MDRASEMNKYFTSVTLQDSSIYASLWDDVLYHHHNNANCFTINCAANNEHSHEAITPQHFPEALGMDSVFLYLHKRGGACMAVRNAQYKTNTVVYKLISDKYVLTSMPGLHVGLET